MRSAGPPRARPHHERVPAETGGTQAWVRDFALALRARGHEAAAYTWRAGAVADALRAEGVPVATRLKDTGPAPDVVHGHHPQAVAALARHTGAPGIFVAHSYSWWMEMPPLLPRVYRYVGVDEPCRERLVALGAPRPDGRHPNPPISRGSAARRAGKTRRALLSQQLRLGETCAGRARSLCAGGLRSTAGLMRQPSRARRRSSPGTTSFALRWRCFATGCAVILWRRMGRRLALKADVDRMRPLNFGRKLLDRPVSATSLLAEIDRYDAADAADASRRVRAVAGLDRMVDAFLGLYAEVLAEHARTPARPWLERRALASYAMRVPAAGALALTPARAWVRNGAARSALLASLLSARRKVLHRRGRPGYGGAAGEVS